eukprot:scaffold65021_cov87-Cyclotella_meneghiniana.AAC.13
MSDGAYEPLLAEDVCPCAVVVMCLRITGNKASLTWVEHSDRVSADNYHAEILGGIALQMLVKVACEGKYISPSMSPRFGCDSKGVVHHGNHPWRPLPANQSQADVLRYYQNLVRNCPMKCKMYHVHGHMDRYLSRHELSPSEILNCDCDKLAGDALRWAVEHNCYINRFLPGEDIVVSVSGCKVTGLYEWAITRHWGKKLDVRITTPKILFPGIVLTSCPEMFSVWATKQVSGFFGNNHLMNHIIACHTVDACPNCGCHPERPQHIIFYRDPARSAVFNSLVDRLVEWLATQRTDASLALLLSEYLCGRGDVLMSSLCTPRSQYYDLAEVVDSLGFRNRS